MPKIKRVTELDKMFLAFQRAATDLEKSSSPDPFRYAEYDYNLAETLKDLIRDLKENEYRPKRAENFYLPKGELAMRPGMIIDILDLSVLNRLLADFILNLDEKLPSGVTAYRIRKDNKLQFRVEREAAYFVLPRYKRDRIKIMESWYNLWPAYRRHLLNDLKSGNYKFLATTDITAFFEDIDLLTLGEILKRKVGSHQKKINVITETYRSWALRDPGNIRQRRGLVQNIGISGLLSNYYLDILDSYLEEEKKNRRIKWYRYCDDINVLCKTKERAKAVLLNIGMLLRQLGLNQNAEKTKILSSEDAIKWVWNETAENISLIIDEIAKKKVNKNDLVARLRLEYKKISRKRVFDRKLEASLFRAYTAALLLDSPILIRRAYDDFLKFPVRSSHICKYARRFVNYLPIFKNFRELLHKKTRLLLYNFQLAFLASVFRNLKRSDKDVYVHLLETALDQKRHWYARIQAINTVFYLGVGMLRIKQIRELLDKDSNRYVRRAAIVLLPLCCNRQETIKWLIELARDLNITVSRMANFLLELTNSEKLAKNQLKKFSQLNYVFLGDQIWRIWFLSLNNNVNVQRSLSSLLLRIDKEFRNYPVIKRHINAIREIQRQLI